MVIEMARSVRQRYQRLRMEGGARLGDPRTAAEEAARAEFAEERLAVFRALGEPTRFLLVELLRRHGPLATTELEMALGIASATLSHHLRVLETARVVVPDAVDGWTFWRVAAYPYVETVVPKG